MESTNEIPVQLYFGIGDKHIMATTPQLYKLRKYPVQILTNVLIYINSVAT